ncbi:DNA adenine methylase [Pedobacter sp. Leaf194]|uniref:DNA adenine methylase n=1 Tax=Pedobacter sp. Leaf194 TaxID=1736297 RepID=UPI0007025B67|nr:DNA adenine methylase [Pedobacter sp. Leaf194]KQS36824.1 modification methylase [Pedobacter sp. Leaf194]
MAGKNKLVSPFIKWVGGKRQLIDKISPHLPKQLSAYTYIEPFIGGGAVLFHLQPKKAIINDFNAELINVYLTIRDDVEALIAHLKSHENTSDYFYTIRSLDRLEGFKQKGLIDRASRFIFLNKTCFNGLYRVNRAGEFNTPFGRYKNPNIVNEPTLRAVSRYLNESEVSIFNGDYAQVLDLADRKSFVYLDPPYHPLSESSNFTGYIEGGWNESHQIRLKEACDDLTDRGIKFLLSNSSAPFILDLYQNYSTTLVKANRAINSNGAGRGKVDEVLIRNYEL